MRGKSKVVVDLVTSIVKKCQMNKKKVYCVSENEIWNLNTSPMLVAWKRQTSWTRLYIIFANTLINYFQCQRGSLSNAHFVISPICLFLYHEFINLLWFTFYDFFFLYHKVAISRSRIFDVTDSRISDITKSIMWYQKWIYDTKNRYCVVKRHRIKIAW